MWQSIWSCWGPGPVSQRFRVMMKRSERCFFLPRSTRNSILISQPIPMPYTECTSPRISDRVASSLTPHIIQRCGKVCQDHAQPILVVPLMLTPEQWDDLITWQLVSTQLLFPDWVTVHRQRDKGLCRSPGETQAGVTPWWQCKERGHGGGKGNLSGMSTLYSILQNILSVCWAGVSMSNKTFGYT